MKVLDLFAGCGGFSLGAHQAGFDVRLAVDIDPVLTSSFATNFPKTELLLADISKLNGSHILAKTGPLDGVFGGPPCQGFSSIGRRNSTDPRRSLFVDFFRLVSEIKPKWFLAENVKGLKFESAKDILQAGLSHVSDQYDIFGPEDFDAAAFGAATRRPRLFIVGFAKHLNTRVTRDDFELEAAHSTTVREAIGDLGSAVYLKEEDGYDYWRFRANKAASSYSSTLRSSDNTFTGHKRTAHTKSVIKRFSKLKEGETDSVGRHMRLSWNGLCPTLRAGTGNDKGSYQSVRPLHPTEPRVITVREAARLQGFPDGFNFHPTVWHSFRMIGNSVSPIIARALFRTIARKLDMGFAQAAE